MSSVIKQGIYHEFMKFTNHNYTSNIIFLDVIRTNPNVDFFREEKIQELMVK